MTILTTLAATTMVVASPVGPVLEPLPPPMEQVVDKSLESKIKPLKCYTPSRIFNIAGQVLDFGTTVYAVEKLGFKEVGPVAKHVIGSSPSVVEVAAFKAIPTIALDFLAKRLLKSKHPEYACSVHYGSGAAGWFAGTQNFIRIVKHKNKN